MAYGGKAAAAAKTYPHTEASKRRVATKTKRAAAVKKAAAARKAPSPNARAVEKASANARFKRGTAKPGKRLGATKRAGR